MYYTSWTWYTDSWDCSACKVRVRTLSACNPFRAHRSNASCVGWRNKQRNRPSCMMKYFAIQSVERVNTSQELFLQECRASYENVWSSLHCCLGWVAACSAPGSLTLAIANAAPISIVNGQRLLTCVYLSKINNHLYITCGNETGEIATYSLSLKGSQVKLNYELKVQLLSRSSVLSISRSSKNDLWAVQATSVSLLRNNILCRVNTTLNTAANATFISAQV